MKLETQKNTFASLISNKFERDVIFESIIIDTNKPTGQCNQEDLRTFIICFIDINSILKKRPARKKGRRLSAEAKSRLPNILNSLSLFPK